MDEPDQNIQYESLSDDEGDMHDENEDKEKESTDPTDPATEGSSKPGTKRKGTRRKRSKAWDTFDELPVGENDLKLGIHLMKFKFPVSQS